jgi:phosphoacetylglucosamine mutase
VEAGLKATNVTYKDFGILTTPQLHYLVRATNTQNDKNPYGEISEAGYYKKLAAAFKAGMKNTKASSSVTVDCANGVGAPKLKEMLKHLPSEEDTGLKITIKNDQIEKAEVLNKDCGADFVKTSQKVPANFNGKPFDRWCSFDGDADRIVYYFNEEGSIFRLLDGDRIATLAASFLGELVEKSGLADKIKIGVVQTAYANGASSKYIEEHLKLKSEFTPTGVKHLHHAAARYDIGVYFEANGHGTVLFSNNALKTIWKTEPESPAQLETLEILRATTELINQTVGDAISDFLLVELILAHKQYTVKEWLSTYTDMPNKLAKALVPRREAYTTVPGTAEQKLATPEGLQEKIDAEVAKYKNGRCFVRASGTEDAVRIYGEAAEAYDVDHLVRTVSDLISIEGGRAP